MKLPLTANRSPLYARKIALLGLYASYTNSRKVLLRRMLTSLKLEEGRSMTSFLEHLKELINELACSGEIIADQEIVEYVLMALPESLKV